MDTRISQYMAEHLGHSPLFDELVLFMSSSHLVKGGMVCAIMAYIWAKVPDGRMGTAARSSSTTG